MPSRHGGPAKVSLRSDYAARRLLRSLRSVMASSEAAQAKLDRIVQLIASEMVAEVCSLYLRRAGEIMELFATQGLKPEAVHKTRLYIGEGLVGDIAAHARPLALAEAQRHPNFAYRPETGEEIFHSLCGVPILRDARVIGVLVIQNRTPRHYFDEEIEVLETIGMVLAELVASANLVSITDLTDTAGNALSPTRLTGVKLNNGIGLGKAVLHTRQVHLQEMVSENSTAELQRLEKAMRSMHVSLDSLLAQQGLRTGESQDVMEAYRMFAEDSGWIGRIKEAILTGLTAEAAVQRVQNETRARMAQVADPYLQERLHDFEDLAMRLQHHLTGREKNLPEGDIIVFARAMGPVELLDYQQANVKGLILEEGSPTSHVSIVARALNIPVIGRVAGALRQVESGDTVIADGDRGQVYIRPNEDVQHRFLGAINKRQEQQHLYVSQRDLPAITRDGVEIELLANAGFSSDVEAMVTMGGAGIGLYRTEIPFMVRHDFPDVTTQTILYRGIIDAAKGRPIYFRTLDVGGDKTLPYMPDMMRDENPAMGWRAIRVSLDRPALLRRQLRALLQAGSNADMRILFPMITDVAEFRQARYILEREKEYLLQNNIMPPRLMQVGAMLEVPALLWQLPLLLKEADFISVGSNDLVQFIFACDRGSARVGNRYDTIHPAMIALLKQVTTICTEAQKPLTVCGEMAASPLDAMALIGAGVRRLSMAPHAIGAIRLMVRSLDYVALANYLQTLQDAGTFSIREQLRHYAQDHGVVL